MVEKYKKRADFKQVVMLKLDMGEDMTDLIKKQFNSDMSDEDDDKAKSDNVAGLIMKECSAIDDRLGIFEQQFLSIFEGWRKENAVQNNKIKFLKSILTSTQRE